MSPADPHGRVKKEATRSMDSEALHDSKTASAKPKEQQKQEPQESIPCSEPQQRKQIIPEVTIREDLVVMQPYKHLSPQQQPQRFETETESPPTEGAEPSPLLSVSTSSSASTVDLTAPCSGTMSGATGVTGNTTPARSIILGRTPGPRSQFIRKVLEEVSRLDEVDDILRRSASVEFSDIKQHHQQKQTQNQTTIQGGFPRTPDDPERVTLQKALGERLARVSTEDVLADAEAHLQNPHALASDPQRPSSSSSWQQGSDSEPQHSMGAETDVVLETGITTPGPDVEQEQRRAIVNNRHASKDRNNYNYNSHTVIDMPELLKTSNRLLEDGKRLLAGGKRRPRQVCRPVGDVWPDKPSHERVEGQSRSQSNRNGWYAHDLLE